MNFLLEDLDNIKVLRIKEARLDSNVAPELKAQLLVLIRENVSVLLDLSAVTYIDSSGLGALLFGVRQAKDVSAKLVLFGAQKRVKSLIQIAQLGPIIMNFENEEDALSYIE